MTNPIGPIILTRGISLPVSIFRCPADQNRRNTNRVFNGASCLSANRQSRGREGAVSDPTASSVSRWRGRWQFANLVHARNPSAWSASALLEVPFGPATAPSRSRLGRVAAWTRLAYLACLVLFLAHIAFASDTKPQTAANPSIDSIQKQAEAARENDHMDDAIKLYKRGVAIKPGWEEGWWSLGNIYYGLDRYEDARDSFRRLATLQPDVGAPWAMLGLSEFETRQYDQALSHLHRGTELHKGMSEEILQSANYHLALLFTRSEQYEVAMKILALFAQRNINDARYVEAMGIAALRKPVLPSESLPTDRQLIMDTGRVMYDAAALRTVEAGTEFRILVDKYPDTPNIHYLYGSFLLFSDADGGLAEMKKELEISPAHVPALVTIASEYLKRGEFQNALPYAQKAVDFDPQSFPAHTLLGRVFSEGKLDATRGVLELETARKLAPNSPEVRIALAEAYTKVGRKEDATRERQEFLKLRKQLDAEANGPQ